MTSPALDETLLIGTREELPKEIEDYLENISEDKEDIRIAFSSDMNLDGEYEDCWFVATDKRILVFNGNHAQSPELFQELLIKEITDVEIKNYVGNGILEVKTADKAIEILRFSKTAFREKEIGEIPTAVDRLREQNGQKVEKRRIHGNFGEHGHREAQRCEKCGGALRWGSCPKCLERRTLLRRVFGYLKPYWLVAVIAFSISLITAGLGIVPQIITKYITDTVFVPAVTAVEVAKRAGEAYIPDTGLLARLTIFILAAIGIHLANTGFGTGRNYMMRWLGNRVILDLRTSAYEHLQRLSLSFYNKKETGRLMSRISYDTERLQDFIVNSIQEFVMDIFMLVGMCTILFITNWRLAALTLIPIPTITFASYIFGRKMHTVYHKVMKRMAGISAILADTIPGVRVVKAFAAEEREIDRFNEENQSYFAISMYAAKLSTIYFPIMGLATFVGGIVVQLFGGRSIIYGSMSMGDLTLFIGYLLRFYGPIRSLTNLNHMLQRSAAAAERVFEIMDAQPEVNDKRNAVELPTIKGDIRFEDVTFSYDDEKNALDGVSFEVKAGEMVGLSGPSGAGKTTIINLLARFYDVTDGAIIIDGHDIRDVKMQSLRDQIGVVLQEPFLFHGTVAQNIAYSRPGTSRSEIIAAAKAANAHDFIMNFPDGYDTLVGERGASLSGGEKQRISIARAILKNPRILILDEATSSVDTATESLIQAAIERLVKGRTTFAIAHRLSTLRKADRLIILEKGEIAEQGNHNELLENNGLYRKLVDLQSELSKIKVV